MGRETVRSVDVKREVVVVAVEERLLDRNVIIRACHF